MSPSSTYLDTSPHQAGVVCHAGRRPVGARPQGSPSCSGIPLGPAFSFHPERQEREDCCFELLILPLLYLKGPACCRGLSQAGGVPLSHPQLTSPVTSHRLFQAWLSGSEKLQELHLCMRVSVSGRSRMYVHAEAIAVYPLIPSTFENIVQGRCQCVMLLLKD